jgi:hypothetical protein
MEAAIWVPARGENETVANHSRPVAQAAFDLFTLPALLLEQAPALDSSALLDDRRRRPADALPLAFAKPHLAATL